MTTRRNRPRRPDPSPTGGRPARRGVAPATPPRGDRRPRATVGPRPGAAPDVDRPARDPRDVVIRRIAKEVGQWPELNLAPLDTTGLKPIDARLAVAIHTETIRRWLTLEYLLNMRLKRPLRELEPKMQAVMLVGACQIFFFDQIPDHAAVDESVTWASEKIRPKAGGMVNAVLRRMAELSLGRSAPRPDREPPPDDEPDDDVVATDLPAIGNSHGDSSDAEVPAVDRPSSDTPTAPIALPASHEGQALTPPSAADVTPGGLCELGDPTDPAELDAAVAASPELSLAANVALPASPRSPSDIWRANHSRLPMSDGRWVLLGEAVLPPDRLERLAIQTSHPVDLIRHWGERLRYRDLERLARHHLVHPPTILAGVSGDLLARFGPLTPSSGDAGPIDEDRSGGAEPTERPVLLEPHAEPGFAVWVGDHMHLTEFLADARANGLGVGGPAAMPGGGPLRVQDPASAEPIPATAVLAGSTLRPGDLIVDLCAGLGTKTLQLRALHPQCRIVASDPDARRAEGLARRFAGDAMVQVVEPRDLLRFAGQAALVVLDVPCSNTAVLARRVEAKYRADPDHLQSLVALQRQIIIDGLRLRRMEGGPRGALLYSTCSLEPAENEEQRRWLTRQHRELRVRHEGRRMPSGAPGEPASTYTDGGYHVLLD